MLLCSHRQSRTDVMPLWEGIALLYLTFPLSAKLYYTKLHFTLLVFAPRARIELALTIRGGVAELYLAGLFYSIHNSGYVIKSRLDYTKPNCTVDLGAARRIELRYNHCGSVGTKLRCALQNSTGLNPTVLHFTKLDYFITSALNLPYILRNVPTP